MEGCLTAEYRIAEITQQFKQFENSILRAIYLKVYFREATLSSVESTILRSLTEEANCDNSTATICYSAAHGVSHLFVISIYKRLNYAILPNLKLDILFKISFPIVFIIKPLTWLFIPRILVVPTGEVKAGFHPFSLDLTGLNYQPPSEEL